MPFSGALPSTVIGPRPPTLQEVPSCLSHGDALVQSSPPLRPSCLRLRAALAVICMTTWGPG